MMDRLQIETFATDINAKENPLTNLRLIRSLCEMDEDIVIKEIMIDFDDETACSINDLFIELWTLADEAIRELKGD